MTFPVVNMGLLTVGMVIGVVMVTVMGAGSRLVLVVVRRGIGMVDPDHVRVGMAVHETSVAVLVRVRRVVVDVRVVAREHCDQRTRRAAQLSTRPPRSTTSGAHIARRSAGSGRGHRAAR